MTSVDAASVDSPVTETIGTRIERDFVGAAGVGLVYLGDRLGLFTALRDGGPATSGELAARTSLVERYMREWLAGVAAAGYVDYDPIMGRFSLTAEQAAYFADAQNPLFAGATAQFQLKILEQADAVAEAFRRGGGVPYSAYDPGVANGFERDSRKYYGNNLVPTWLPALPGVIEALRDGGAMLDVGCGGGGACFAVARAFPTASVVGIDTHGPAIERARADAAATGLDARVTFKAMNAAELPEASAYDLVTAFEIVHDLADPVAGLRGIHRSLKPTGACLTRDPFAADTVEGNLNAQGKLLYWASVFYCMTVSLAQEGIGLGTCMGEAKARELAVTAGFTSVRRLPLGDETELFLELRR
ncbi:MAG TPA: methyltransferase domain-containing protein [Chloroflexota bacterium]|jgi:2-polyprenyl-3-methyl-5-hydroxy-6-metoxy-1,4-benzoquinol methylase